MASPTLVFSIMNIRIARLTAVMTNMRMSMRLTEMLPKVKGSLEMIWG